MNEPTNADVLDAVTLELSRFTRDVVSEVHRLRDELVVERQRTDQLESTVQSLKASLRKYDTQAAGLVDHVVNFSTDVERRLSRVEQHADVPSTSFASTVPSVPVEHEPLDDPPPTAPPHSAVQTSEGALNEADGGTIEADGATIEADDETICFAPLTLSLEPLESGPIRDTTIDELIARVVDSIPSTTTDTSTTTATTATTRPSSS